MIKYTYTEADIKEVERIVSIRHDAKEEKGVQSRRFYSKRDDRATHVVGVRGELAAARVLRIPLDETFFWAGDEGWDLKLGETTIDVKTRVGKHRDLAFKSMDEFKAKMGLLVWVESVSMYSPAWVIGFMNRSEFELVHRTEEWLPGRSAHFVPWADLHPIEMLLK
jgi:hypothetical protein